LKYALRSSFFNIYYLQQTAKVYDEEIQSLKTIGNAYKEVKGKGYVSEADVVSIQAQLYSLQNEYQALVDNINDNESQLRIMLQSTNNNYIKPLVDTGIVKADPLAFKLSTLLDSAYANRTDLMIAKDNLTLSQQNLSYQKALAVPDITLGPGFVNQSNFIKADWVYVVGFSIPVFNRNQGNIKSARQMIDYSDAQLQLTRKTLEEQVFRGLQKALDADKLYKGIDPAFANKFDALASEMMKNYMKRNVSLLNFLTFYDSYKQNIIQLNTILFNKVNAMENLNFLTGTNFFNK
jgi:cobalt-zinc-cadmium efflux system outer membrane protein